MSEKTIELTNLDPRIVELQNNILNKYIESNRSVKKGQIVITGSSTVEIFPIEKLQKNVDLNHLIYNRGIRATTTEYLLNNINTLIFDLNPSILFIQIGSNDIGFNVPEEKFLKNYNEIMDKISTKLPNTTVYIMAYYPINTVHNFGEEPEEHAELNKHRSNEYNIAANAKVKALADKHNFNYINLNDGLTDNDGNLKYNLTFDGLHPLPIGYDIVFKNMTPYLN